MSGPKSPKFDKGGWVGCQLFRNQVLALRQAKNKLNATGQTGLWDWRRTRGVAGTQAGGTVRSMRLKAGFFAIRFLVSNSRL